MTRITMIAMIVAVAVLVIAGPSQAESAFELSAAERTISAGVSLSSGDIGILPTAGFLQAQPGWFKSIDDRDVR